MKVVPRHSPVTTPARLLATTIMLAGVKIQENTTCAKNVKASHAFSYRQFRAYFIGTANTPWRNPAATTLAAPAAAEEFKDKEGPLMPSKKSIRQDWKHNLPFVDSADQHASVML